MTRFGGLPDMAKLMQQAKQMQEDAGRLQAEMDEARFTAGAGGGMVTATVDGYGKLVDIKINPAVVDPGDVEMLQDLVLTATKEAADQAARKQEERMASITEGLGGLKLPGGLL